MTDNDHNNETGTEAETEKFFGGNREEWAEDPKPPRSWGKWVVAFILAGAIGGGMIYYFMPAEAEVTEATDKAADKAAALVLATDRAKAYEAAEAEARAKADNPEPEAKPETKVEAKATKAKPDNPEPEAKATKAKPDNPEPEPKVEATETGAKAKPEIETTDKAQTEAQAKIDCRVILDGKVVATSTAEALRLVSKDFTTAEKTALNKLEITQTLVREKVVSREAAPYLTAIIVGAGDLSFEASAKAVATKVAKTTTADSRWAARYDARLAGLLWTPTCRSGLDVLAPAGQRDRRFCRGPLPPNLGLAGVLRAALTPASFLDLAVQAPRFLGANRQPNADDNN